MIRRSRPKRGRFGAAFLRDCSGVAAVEFALISPTIILVLVGLVDLGGMLYTRFQLDASLTSGANYAMINGTSVNATSAAALANTLAGLVSSGQSSNWANSSVTPNSRVNMVRITTENSTAAAPPWSASQRRARVTGPAPGCWW